MSKIKTALVAIDDVFSDTSVSQQETLEGLVELLDEIVLKINTVRSDLRSHRTMSRGLDKITES